MDFSQQKNLPLFLNNIIDASMNWIENIKDPKLQLCRSTAVPKLLQILWSSSASEGISKNLEVFYRVRE